MLRLRKEFPWISLMYSLIGIKRYPIQGATVYASPPSAGLLSAAFV